MNTAKDKIRALLDKLPDDCSLEDVQYHLYVVEKIRKSEERARRKGTRSQEEIEREFTKWTSR